MVLFSPSTLTQLAGGARTANNFGCIWCVKTLVLIRAIANIMDCLVDLVLFQRRLGLPVATNFDSHRFHNPETITKYFKRRSYLTQLYQSVGCHKICA